MATIIAGRFQQQADVDQALDELQRVGFAREGIASFYLNPAGQHATYPIGGDRAISPGAKETGKGVAIGAAAGAAVGIAATPFLGPIGTVTSGLLGAHVGGLVGSLAEMKEKGETGEHGEDIENVAPVRKSGVFVAIAAHNREQESRAISMLRIMGAADIEHAEGAIVDGDWIDFDPVKPPELILPAPE